MTDLTDADHALVTDAVTRAELATSGEIVTVVARSSDAYHDVAAHWAILAMLSILTLLAIVPALVERLYLLLTGEWESAVPLGVAFTAALILLVIAFLLARLALAWSPLRLALTPESTKARRVHRRALELFRAAVEKRTRAATGVLLYVSLAERRAEIVADDAIHSRVDPSIWGEAMHELVTALRDGRPGEGMAAAVDRIGVILAEHFPRSSSDANELPDRLVEL